MEEIIESVSAMESGISGLDTVWVLLAAMLVFFMQPGFALVEAGFTRSKNTANILIKTQIDHLVAVGRPPEALRHIKFLFVYPVGKTVKNSVLATIESDLHFLLGQQVIIVDIVDRKSVV